MTAAVQTYKLCRRCAERQGGPVFEIVPGGECTVCAGLMDRVDEMAALAAKSARRFEFKTFGIGVSVPGGVQEREDEMRSNLRLKGRETVKAQAGRMIAAQVAHELGKSMDRGRPDLTVLADFGSGEVFATSRPVYYYGRYAKPGRIPQRRALCEACRGGGCEKCKGTGFERKPSVEALLRMKLAGFSGSEKMTFTWLGSEDRESRVLPPGRPFVAEVKSPRKRKLPTKFGVRFRGGIVSVSKGRVLPSKPLRLPGFRFRTKIVAVARTRVPQEAAAALRARFKNAPVRFERPHARPTVKTVHRVSATMKGRTLFIDAELDGGLPVKRFVSGELVSPSVSEVLKTEVSCRSFDICGVSEKGRFGFAEITRGEEKN